MRAYRLRLVNKTGSNGKGFGLHENNLLRGFYVVAGCCLVVQIFVVVVVVFPVVVAVGVVYVLAYPAVGVTVVVAAGVYVVVVAAGVVAGVYVLVGSPVAGVVVAAGVYVVVAAGVYVLPYSPVLAGYLFSEPGYPPATTGAVVEGLSVVATAFALPIFPNTPNPNNKPKIKANKAKIPNKGHNQLGHPPLFVLILLGLVVTC